MSQRTDAAARAGAVRNVVLVGHAGAGKTSLVEAVLAGTGAITRAGSVADGTTVCDHDEVEKRLGRSVALSVAHTTVPHPAEPGTQVRLTFLDTPGHPDFVGELRAGLRAADAALFVVSAVDGVDGATRLAWDECAAVGMPRLVVVTHLDRPRADFDTVLEICQRVFGEGVQPLYLPMLGDDDVPVALLGLLSWTVFDTSSGELEARPAEPGHVEAAQERRNQLVEGIIAESEDDDLLDRYLAGKRVPYDQLVTDLEAAVARGSFFPVLPCVPTSGLGVRELVEVVVRGLPGPDEHPVPRVTRPDGSPRAAVTADPDGPLVAEVVKTTSDPYVGRISLVRVFSGRLTASDEVHVSGHLVDERGEVSSEGHDVDERAAGISLPQGATLVPVTEAIAGDVVAVSKLLHAETADTLSSPSDPALMEPWVLPEPLLPVAISSPSTAQEDKLVHGLARLQAEDPTARVVVDPDTGQQVLWCMGEAHLEVLLERLAARSGVRAVTAPVRVAVRETVTGTGTGHGRHVKQSGGHGQYAVVDLAVEPLPQGGGVEFVDEVVGGAVPRQFVGSVEKGVRAQLARGVRAGYPMVDVRVRLTGGKAHSVDSSDAAFSTAGALALAEAATAAGIAFLEPVDEVDVVVDDEFVGAVMADLSGRRARVTGSEPEGSGRTRVRAQVPASELTRYAVDLRAVAHGTGAFTRSYAHHSPAPPHVADRLTAG
jgi:elongation factor G